MKVLIATDGSEFSDAAIRACCDLVNMGNVAAIKIVAVYEAQVPMPSEPFAISAEYYQRLDDLARGRAKESAEQAADTIRRDCPGKLTDISTKIEIGRPAQIIVETATEFGADLLIVGSHGRGFWGRLTLGSVSDAVIHHAPCSVLVVRGTGSKTDGNSIK